MTGVQTCALPICFPVTIYAQENTGIFLWALQGYERVKQDGFEIPETIQRATNEYKQSQDIFKMFIDEECQKVDEKEYDKLKDLRISYNRFCDENRMNSCQKNPIEFKKLLSDYGYKNGKGFHNDNIVYGLMLKSKFTFN